MEFTYPQKRNNPSATQRVRMGNPKRRGNRTKTNTKLERSGKTMPGIQHTPQIGWFVLWVSGTIQACGPFFAFQGDCLVYPIALTCRFSQGLRLVWFSIPSVAADMFLEVFRWCLKSFVARVFGVVTVCLFIGLTCPNTKITTMCAMQG